MGKSKHKYGEPGKVTRSEPLGRNYDVLSPSEALYGFCGWITTRKQVVKASGRHDAAVWADLVKTYCEHQGFQEPVKGWDKNLKPMPEGI